MLLGGIGGGVENEEIEVSSFRIRSSDTGDSQGGGRMLARRCRLRRRASHRGREAWYGGCKGAIGP